jgi:hypothetical protein
MTNRRVTNSYEVMKADELERADWIVIREFEQGRPDVVAMKKRPDGGWDVKVREFKGVGTKISNEQGRLITKLRQAEVDAEFIFEQDEPKET